MNRKHLASWTAAALLCLALLGAGGCAASGGDAAAPAQTGEDAVVARVGGETILRSDVEQKISGGFLPGEGNGQEPLSEEEALDILILERLLWAEAEAQGVLPTEEEAKAHVASFVEQYEAHPEDYPEIETYREANDISFEECVRRMEEDTRLVFGIAGLEEIYAREYCQAQGIEFSGVNQSREVRDAVEEKKSELLEAHRGEIQYETEQTNQN